MPALKARLSDAFDRFLEGVPDNRQVVFDDDGWRLKTDPAEHPDPAQSDSLVKLHRWLDARSRSIRLADLLIEVENGADGESQRIVPLDQVGFDEDRDLLLRHQIPLENGPGGRAARKHDTGQGPYMHPTGACTAYIPVTDYQTNVYRGY